MVIENQAGWVNGHTGLVKYVNFSVGRIRLDLLANIFFLISKVVNVLNLTARLYDGDNHLNFFFLN